MLVVKMRKISVRALGYFVMISIGARYSGEEKHKEGRISGEAPLLSLRKYRDPSSNCPRSGALLPTNYNKFVGSEIIHCQRSSDVEAFWSFSSPIVEITCGGATETLWNYSAALLKTQNSWRSLTNC